MDKSCPSCHVELSAKESRFNFLSRKGHCPHCDATVVKTRPLWPKLLWIAVFPTLFIIPDLNQLIKQHYPTGIAYWLAKSTLIALYMGLFQLCLHFRFAYIDKPLWQLKEPLAQK